MRGLRKETINYMENQKYRVAICEHTKKKVVQVQETPTKWLCLHRENELLDKMAVEAFEAGQGIDESER